MNAIITAGLALATEVLKLINTNTARKYLDKSVKLALEIEKEEAKGQKAIDSKIESLLKEYEIILDAAKKEIELYRARNPS